MTDPKPGAGHCLICNQDIVPGGPQDALNHIRVMHPDDYSPVETWPDGTPVVVDDDPTPDMVINEGTG